MGHQETDHWTEFGRLEPVTKSVLTQHVTQHDGGPCALPSMSVPRHSKPGRVRLVNTAQAFTCHDFLVKSAT